MPGSETAGELAVLASGLVGDRFGITTPEIHPQLLLLVWNEPPDAVRVRDTHTRSGA